MAREIVKGRNWRNLKVLIVLGVLATGNILFHIEVHTLGAADYGIRFGIAATMMLIMLVGDDIIQVLPATGSWNPGRLPAPSDRFDLITIVAAIVALLAWIATRSNTTGAALIAAGLLQALRLGRWAGERTLRDRLVLILHVAYAFVRLASF